MKILVTGAAGAIGSHVAEAFKRAGHDVLGLDAVTDYYSPKIKEITIADLGRSGIEVVRLDLSSDDLAFALEGVEAIYHFAAQPGISASTAFEAYVKNNIIATHRLLEAAGKVPSLRIFVHISTSSVYGAKADSDEATEPKPTSHYGVTKLASEQLALSYFRDKGLPVAVLRLFSVYGERERPEKLYHKVIRNVLRGEPLTLYDGSERHIRSYTHVSDVVDACSIVLAKAALVRGEIFNIGSDKTITTGEGLALIERIIDKKIAFKRMPRRAGDQIETSARIDKARRILGYDPKVSPEEGLRREVAWYREKIEGKVGQA
ncbi:MAG: NAD-dependent epimerase/dehydratase family protein [Candidatus Taylorbacteria bacterium]|nr:NAD-dependent epimerase/dehydratase family protein [Candidatus Taylorbacteria bacterium]